MCGSYELKTRFEELPSILKLELPRNFEQNYAQQELIRPTDPVLVLKNEGKTTTSSSIMYDIVRKFSSGKKINFSSDGESKLHLESEKSIFNLNCIDASEFPLTDENFNENESKEIYEQIKNEYEKAPNSFGSNEGRKESYLELLLIISDQISKEYKSIDVKLTKGIPELIKTKSKSSSVQSARVSRVLEISADKEIKLIERHFTFLATVGSTAPFIGLFGTVWGIMNSFQSIAISRNTSLAIVAPWIAEALFATALGLLAAIPAVVAYNKFNSDSRRYFSKIDKFSKRFISII